MRKLESYYVLKTVAPMAPEVSEISNQYDKNKNDLMDSVILNEVFCHHVDVLISEDKKIHKKAEAQEKVDTIILYATAPKSVVVGEVCVIGRLEKPPTVLWEETKKNAGITRKKYREYFLGKKKACAYVLGKSVKYEREIPLDELGIRHAPQSFLYLSDCLSPLQTLTTITKEKRFDPDDSL